VQTSFSENPNIHGTSLVARVRLQRRIIRDGEHAEHMHEVEGDASLALVLALNKVLTDNELQQNDIVRQDVEQKNWALRGGTTTI
jgi:hypothetical protein